MLFKSAFVLLLANSVANGFSPVMPAMATRGGCLPMSTAEANDTDASKMQETARRTMMAARLQKQEGKKAGNDAPPVNIGWDSHKPVVCSQLFFLCLRHYYSKSSKVAKSHILYYFFSCDFLGRDP